MEHVSEIDSGLDRSDYDQISRFLFNNPLQYTACGGRLNLETVLP